MAGHFPTTFLDSLPALRNKEGEIPIPTRESFTGIYLVLPWILKALVESKHPPILLQLKPLVGGFSAILDPSLATELFEAR